MHFRILFVFILILSSIPVESHDMSKTLPYGQLRVYDSGNSQLLAGLEDSQAIKKVNTTLRVSHPSRLHIKRGLMASPTKCYAATLFAVAVVDLFSWLICKLDSQSTSLVSDRYFCLLLWSQKKTTRQFAGRMVLYSLGHGNVFHFLGKTSSFNPILLSDLFSKPYLRSFVAVNFFIITVIGPRVEGKLKVSCMTHLNSHPPSLTIELYGREKTALLLVATILLGGAYY